MADKARAKPIGRGRFYVVQQHQRVEVVEASERPDITVQEGERRKTVRGPYSTKDEAERERDRLRGATLRVQSGREAI